MDAHHKAPRGIARFDSATGMARALGEALHGREFTSLTGSPALDRMLPLVNGLPRHAREWFYAFAGTVEALPRSRIAALDLGRIAEWLVQLYPHRTYPAAFIGSSNGGMVHMAAALGVPWLPQTMMCPVRQIGSDPDDARQGFRLGAPIVEELLRVAPDVSVHHMHDPNQDRLMLRTMSYYRLKWRRLPLAYRQALAGWLARGATLYVIDCAKRWPVKRTSERSVFQFGAAGGVPSEEYLRGSKRVAEYLARYHVGRSGWDPPEPDDEAPEAEWGFDPALRDELYALAAEHGWRVVEIRFENPEALSGVAALACQSWYQEEGSIPGPYRVLAESFILMAPLRAQLLRAVPVWLLFAVEPSARFLRTFLEAQDAFEQVDLFLFSHGTEGVGVVPIDEWRRLALRGRRPGTLLGVDVRRYPRDFATFARFHRAVEQLGPLYPAPSPLGVQRFEALLKQHAPAYGVALIERAAAVSAG